MQKRHYVLLLLFLYVTTFVFAGTTGKIAGKIKDENGNPVPFANIIIKQGETTITGSQANDKGAYFIINIPPGIYDIQCSQVGYKPAKLTGVKVNIDETAVKNIVINSTALEMEGVTIIEDRYEMVSKSNTTSGRTVTSESIEEIPIESIDGIVAIQAGATVTNGELHIRGGRANEVVYSVDGMSVSDPVDGGGALTIDTDAIKDMKVMTGGFTAEYGNAQSGIVNIITKDGSREYTGKVELNTDHLISNLDHSNSDNFKFALGGPVLTHMVSTLRDKFVFFFNVAANWHDSRYHEYYTSDPVTELRYLSSNWNEYPIYDKYDSRENVAGFDLGQRNYNLYNANLKLKYTFNERQNLTLSVSGDKNIWEPYSHNWKYALEHYAQGENNQRLYKMTYDHLFNSQMNLKIKGSVYEKKILFGPIGITTDQYFVRNDAAFDFDAGNEPYLCTGIEYLTYDGIYNSSSVPDWNYNVNASPRPLTEFVSPGSIYGFNQDDENSIYTLRSDFDYQMNNIHGFKTGFEIMKHYIRKDQLSSPWVIDFFRYDEFLTNEATPVDSVWNEVEEIWIPKYSLDDLYAATLAASGQTDGYEASPYQAAYYLQDKMEWEGMIVNAGLRFDFWYLGEKYKIFRDAGKFDWEYFDKSKRFQMMLSPRLGISHPISDKSVLHFAYNYQNQLPQMQYVFTSKTKTDAITNTGVVLGAADLEPQITVTYEVGLQKQLSEDYVMDVTAYYKNIYNYITTMKVSDPIDETVSWYQLISEDYGSARGIDINLEKMLSNFISGSTSYSLAWADGNNSDVVIQDAATNLREFPLDWDMRHNFSFNLSFRIGNDEEYTLPFTDIALPWDNFSMNLLYNIASGTPYTPRNEEDTENLDTNSATKPYTETADLSISKKFNFTEKTYVRLYANINNLFNKKNVYNVYSKTGSPYYDGADLSEGNTDYVPEEVQYVHDLATNNPGNVSSGRKLTFGFSFHW